MRTIGAIPKVDIGILTIKDEEFAAVLAVMSVGLEHYEAPSHRHYNLCLVDAGGGRQYRVAIARQPEQGTGAAQDFARDFVIDLAPTLLIVVGIAGAVPSVDLTLGDVVVATSIHDYTLEARHDGDCEYAIAGGPMARSIEGVIANLHARKAELGDWAAGLPARPAMDPDKLVMNGPDAWQARVKKTLAANAHRSAPVFVTGPIGSSDRLIKDPRILIDWQRTARNLLAVEMEAAGIYRATRDRCPMVAIRGISDVVGLERDEVWVGYACAAAAAFTKAFLRTRPVPCNEGCRAGTAVGRRRQEKEENADDLAAYLTSKLLAERPSVDLHGLRVLVVDDEKDIHPMLKRMLQKCGVDPQFANDGTEALRLLSKSPPNLVLSDILMAPLDGIGLAREIRGIDPSIPIVFMSGFPACLAEPATREHSCAILEKPFQMKHLHTCLQNVVADTFRLRAPDVWPDHHEVVHAYHRCRASILSFLDDIRANGLFGTLLHYELKRCVRSCVRSARAGEPGAPLLATMEDQIAKLQAFASRFTLGRQLRLTDYLKAVVRDLTDESPHFRIEVSIEGDVDLQLATDLQTLFTLATLELLENARAALAGRGTVHVSLRRRVSVGKLLLRVRSDRELLPSGIVAKSLSERVGANDQGRGMGLALVQAMAIRLRGQLRMIQHDGVEFVLEAPVAGTDCLPPGRPPDLTSPSSGPADGRDLDRGQLHCHRARAR